MMKSNLLVFSLLIAPMAVAQVPPHHAVVSTIAVGNRAIGQRGTTGVFLVPLPTTANPGPFVPARITGLPPSLVSGVVTGSAGAGGLSVAYRSADDTLFAGNIGHSTNGNRGTVFIHAMTLNGSAVRTIDSLRVGQVSSGFRVGVSSLSVLPDQRILAVVGQPAAFLAGSGPGAVSPLLLVDTVGGTPTATPVPVTPALPGFAETGTVSRDGRTAYVMTQPGNGVARWGLYAVGLDPSSPDYGRSALLYSWAERTRSPEMRADGKLQVAGYDSTNVLATSYVIDVSTRPVGVTATPVVPADVSLVGPRMEPATGAAIYTATAWPGTRPAFANAVVVDAANNGNIALLAAEPAAGWCIPAAMTIHSAFERYGEGTPAGATYDIVSEANPGGLPELGNAGFGVTIRAQGAAPAASFLMVGVARTSTQVAGVRSLVAPLMGLPMVTQGQDASITLPLAADVSLLGARIFVQGVHVDAGGLATSDAARIQVIR